VPSSPSKYSWQGEGRTKRDCKTGYTVEPLRREEGRFARVPELTRSGRLVLDAIALCDGRALSEVEFARPDGREFKWPKELPRVLRRLIAAGLIEVTAIQPAV
jgi:hypothetical protein